jgi:hypothetical protein
MRLGRRQRRSNIRNLERNAFIYKLGSLVITS